MAQHRIPRLTLQGRLTLIRRIEQGGPIANAADEMGVSRTTAGRWRLRFQTEGEAGINNRPAVAHRRPHWAAERLERRAIRLRWQRKGDSSRIAPRPRKTRLPRRRGRLT